MEIVIGAMLLIGAFALGQTTAHQDAPDPRGVLADAEIVRSSEVGVVPQGCRYRIDGPVQRDLTLPYSRQRLGVVSRSKEAGSACRD